MNPLTKVFVALRAAARHPLYRQEPIRAMWAFCRTQIAARALGCEVCVGFPNQTKLLVPPRMKGAAHFIFPRLCEFEDMAFVMHFLRPDDLFCDGGANIGAYTVLASGVAGARTIAFEPSPSTYLVLEDNVRLNGLNGKVITKNLALGRNAGTVPFAEGLGTESRVLRDAGNETMACTKVKVSRLDDELAGQVPALMKIDVEGYEVEVFAGAKAILAAPSLQALVVERWRTATRPGSDEAKLHAEIRSAGFSSHRYVPAERRLMPLDDQAFGDIIYVRDLKAASERLRKASPFRIDGNQI